MTDPIAPDALREAVAVAVRDAIFPHHAVAVADEHREIADAVLAVVDQHRDAYTEQVQQRALELEERSLTILAERNAEVERLRRSVGYWRERCCGECDANAAQDRIARALAVLKNSGVGYPAAVAQAVSILTGTD